MFCAIPNKGKRRRRTSDFFMRERSMCEKSTKLVQFALLNLLPDTAGVGIFALNPFNMPINKDAYLSVSRRSVNQWF